MPTTAAQTEAFPDLQLEESASTETDNTHDLIRSMMAAEAEEASEEPAQDESELVETTAERVRETREDLDLIRSMIEEEDEEEEFAEFEETDPSPEVDLEAPETDDIWEDGSLDYDADDFDEEEPVQKLSWAARRRQKAEAKRAAKTARLAEKQAKIDAKAEARAARAAAKQAKIDAAAEARAARAAAKQAKVDAKAEAKAERAAAKQAKLDAAAEAKAARAAAKQAKIDAAEEARASRAAAKQAKADAAAAAKAERAAAIQEKAHARAEAKAARAALKQAAAAEAAEKKAAALAAKQAKADAKAEAKAAKVAAKQAKKEASAPPLLDKETEELQKNVLKAVAGREEGGTGMEPAEFIAPADTATRAAPVQKKKIARISGKPMRERVAELRTSLAKNYERLPQRPTRQQFLRATAVFVLLVEPWLVPIVSLITVVSLTFAYFAMGPDRAAEITGAGYRWLEKREPERAERIRQTAERVSEKMSGWIGRLPDRWSRGIHMPDFSKDNGENDKLIEDRFDRLARESRRL